MKVSKLLLSLLAFVIATELKAQNFAWARSMGGPDVNFIPSDRGNAIKTDASGNVYTTGNFVGSVDFDPGAGIYTLTAMNGNTASTDMFIQKLDGNGNFLWAKQLVGDSSSAGYGIALDAFNNIYVTGYIRGTKDFDPGPGVYNLSSKGNADIFILKLDANGNFIWARAMGGVSSEGGFGIAVDGAGNTFVTGRFLETVDFDPGIGVYNLTSAGNFDIFVFKLDNSGNFVWAKQLGGNGFDYGNAIASDLSGNIYLTGAFTGTTDFDPGPGVFNITALSRDIFVWKLTNSGNLVWAKQMTCNLDALGYGLAVDNAGNVFYTGHFWGTVDFNPGTGVHNLTTVASSWDIYIAKLNSSGDFAWVKQFGDIYDEEGLSIAVDAADNVYTTGYFQGNIDFDPGPGTNNLTSADNDVFIQKMDNSGNFVWAFSMGGPSNEVGYAITISNAGDIFTTGSFRNTADFDPGPGVSNLVSKGGEDIFIHKLGSTQCPLVQAGAISGNASPCSGTTQTYSINAVSGASSYTWSLPSGWTGNSTTNSITTTAGTGSGNISVTANNSCGSGPAKTLAVNVSPVPLQPGVIAGSNSVCHGSSQIYSISTVSGATSYTWSLPSGWTGSSTTNTINTIAGTNSGNISVTANNSCGSSPAQTLAIIVGNSTLQAPGTISGSNSICQSSSQTYSISAVSGATSYTWLLPSGWTGSSNTNSITTTAGASSGNISVTANNGCGNSPAQTLAVTVNPVPLQPGVISGNNSVCQGTSQTYSISAVSGATSYSWTLPVGWIGSSSTNSITTTVGANSGSISVRPNNSCGSSTIQTLPVTVTATPSQPGIITGNTNVNVGQTNIYSITPVNTATEYTWTLSGGGNIMSGQNTTSISVNWFTAGNYSLSVNASNSCGKSNDNVINIISSTNTNPGSTFDIKITPNPSRGINYLMVKGVTNNMISVKIFNQVGQIVYKSSYNAGIGNYTQLIDLSNVASGIYTAEIFIDNEKYYRPIVRIN